MHYPVFLVEISNHNFVRWQRDKKTWYDFETMDGFIPPDGDSYYVSGHGFHVDERERVEDGYLSNMSPTRIIEYHDRLIARAASWKHDYATMIRFYELAFITDPRRGEAANDVAWFYAAFPDPNLRDGRKAVEYAKKAVALDPSVDNLDTLACAYAQATDMNDARATEAKIAALNTRPSNPSIATDAGVIAGGGTCKDPTLIDSDPLPFRPNAQKQTRMPTTRELKNLH
jgi:tetratricopeptide (TPR) repeat protein